MLILLKFTKQYRMPHINFNEIVVPLKIGFFICKDFE